MKGIVAILLAFSSTIAWAVPVTWTLDSVLLEESEYPSGDLAYRTLTGSFVYDADTNTYSEILIKSEAGSYLWFGNIYSEDARTRWSAPIESPTDSGVILNAYTDCFDLFCETSLSLSYGSALTNVGGTIVLSGQEDHVEFGLGVGGSRYIVSGSLVGTVVPIPAAIWLFVSALAVFGWRRKARI